MHFSGHYRCRWRHRLTPVAKTPLIRDRRCLGGETRACFLGPIIQARAISCHVVFGGRWRRKAYFHSGVVFPVVQSAKFNYSLPPVQPESSRPFPLHSFLPHSFQIWFWLLTLNPLPQDRLSQLSSSLLRCHTLYPLTSSKNYNRKTAPIESGHFLYSSSFSTQIPPPEFRDIRCLA